MKATKSLLVSSILLSLSACGGKSFDEHVAEAQVLLEQGNEQAAVIELRNALQQQPDSGNIRLLLADSYMKLGQVAFAEKEYEAALRLGQDPDLIVGNLVKSIYSQDKFEDTVSYEIDDSLSPGIRVKVKVIQALAHFRLGDNEAGQQLINETNAIDSSSIYKKLGQTLLTANQSQEEAVNLLNRILEEQPELTEAILVKGLLSTALKNYDDAVVAYQKHLELLPNGHQVRLFLANALVKNSQLEEAEKQADFILKLSTEQPFAHQIKALVNFENGSFDAALPHIEKAIQNGINSDSNRLLAGLSAFQVEKFEQAHKHLSAIEDKLSDSHPAKRALAVTQLQLGYTLDASNTLNDLENLTEQDSQLLAAASYELIQAGELEKAESSIENLEQVASSDALSIAQVGILKLSLKDVEGLTSLEQAVEIDPDLPQARLALAAAYIQTKKFDKALELAESWISAEPEKTDGYNLAGLIHVQNGNQEGAEVSFSKAYSLDNNNTASLMYFSTKSAKNEDYEQSLEHLANLLKSRPTYLPALKLNYRIQNKLGNTQGAIRAIEDANKEVGDSQAHGVLLAQAYYSESKYAEAIEVLESLPDYREGLNRTYWLTLANSYLKNGESPKAIRTLAEWTQISPKSESVWLQKIELEESLNLYEDALNTTRSSLVHLPESQRLLLVEANLLVSFNRQAEAQRSLDKVTPKTSSAPFARKIQGHIFALQGKNKEALPLLLEGYKASPALRNAGLVFVTYKALSQIEKAFEFLELHISEQPNDISSRLLIANEYLATKPNKAKTHYSKVVELTNNNILALNNLAYLHQKDNELKLADKYASEAVNIAPENAQVLDTAGSIKIDLGEKHAALALLEKATKLAPRDSNIKSNLMRAKAL